MSNEINQMQDSIIASIQSQSPNNVRVQAPLFTAYIRKPTFWATDTIYVQYHHVNIFYLHRLSSIFCSKTPNKKSQDKPKYRDVFFLADIVYRNIFPL